MGCDPDLTCILSDTSTNSKSSPDPSARSHREFALFVRSRDLIPRDGTYLPEARHTTFDLDTPSD